MLSWALWGFVATLVIAVAGLAWHVGRYLAYHRARGLPGPGLSSNAVRNEVSSLVEVGWLRLLRWRASDLQLPPKRTGRTVALVHGYLDQAASFWRLRDHLTKLGRPTIGIELGFQLGKLPRYGRRLERALRRILRNEPDGIDIVAHSMGGIVLRLVLHEHPDLRKGIRHVVTLGTPHLGTASVDQLPLLPEWRALHPDSEFLADLPALTELVDPDTVVTVGGDFDMVVYPVEHALDPAGRTEVITEIGHAGLLTDDRVLSLVAEAIAA
ncbi:MAG: hypothetical protein AAGA48_41325 [Myxococcota bacterium]